MEPTDPLITWLWSTLESFSNEERILFMRFVSGRSRLPATVSDISQRFQIVKVDRVSKTYTPVSFRWLFIWPLLFENIVNDALCFADSITGCIACETNLLTQSD